MNRAPAMRMTAPARSKAARRRRLDRRLSVENLEGRVLLNAADLDLTFGASGVVAVGSMGGGVDVAVQPNGKVISGATEFAPAPGAPGFGLVRYTTAGRLDTSFGGDGRVKTDFGKTRSELSGLALDPGGADSADKKI